jgi:hypothetical protein
MARYTVQTATGPKRKTVYGKTRREVDEKLTKAKADRDVGLAFDVDAGHMTVGTFIERWLEDSVRGYVRQSTYPTSAMNPYAACMWFRRWERRS